MSSETFSMKTFAARIKNPKIPLKITENYVIIEVSENRYHKMKRGVPIEARSYH